MTIRPIIWCLPFNKNNYRLTYKKAAILQPFCKLVVNDCKYNPPAVVHQPAEDNKRFMYGNTYRKYTYPHNTLF